MRGFSGLVLAALLAAATAHAQRTAVSAQLSPEMAAEAFTRAVLDVCVPAAAGGGVSGLAAAREGALQPTQDADTRRQAGASAGDTVWDVTAARGVVTVREAAGRCVVSVYGPAVAATIAGAVQSLSGAGFEAMAGGADGFRQTLLGAHGGARVSVQLSGSEPGAPGHQSRFAVVTASVAVVR
jgi:hypothetical protein